MIITSAIVFATNVTINMTNQSVTGAMIGIPSNSQEFSFPIEIWANTSIDLTEDGNIVRAILLLDNGSAIPDKTIDFYLNDTIIFSDSTDKNGMIGFSATFPGIVKAAFTGDDYLNPSETQMNFRLESSETDEAVELLEITQGKAEVGKDVEWSKKIRMKNLKDSDEQVDLSSEIPEFSFNSSIDELMNGKWQRLGKIFNMRAKEAKELLLKYYTKGPEQTEDVISRYNKIVTISSQMHYENVSVYSDIDETPLQSVRLYWIINGERVDVTDDPLLNVSFVDTNGNGLIDRVEWIVPHMSDQVFEISIEVLNPYTYLRDGDNWIVAFNTIGTADLTINSTNAGWAEFFSVLQTI